MIIKAPLSGDLLLSLISAVSEQCQGCTWSVIDPQFIMFSSEEEHEAREIMLKGGSSLYQLSDQEMLNMVRNGELGFDWTDVIVSRVAKDEAFLYIQCVDACILYVRSDDGALLCELMTYGFHEVEASSLPFDMWTKEKLLIT